MKVLVYESNLLWSVRIANHVRALGHSATVMAKPTPRQGDIAIVNLGEGDASTLVPSLKNLGVKTIGHAGHKEKDLFSLGRQSGCDVLATNSQLRNELPALLEKASQ